MNEKDIFDQAVVALRQVAVKGVESFVSQAIGQPIQITSGPLGQIVVGPPVDKIVSNPGQHSTRIMVPLLVGAAVLTAINLAMEQE